MIEPSQKTANLTIPVESIHRYHDAIRDQLRNAFEAVLEGDRFTLGPQLLEFEREFAAYCGAHSAVGVSSGTTALTLALRALGVGPGDEVITVPNTYVATAFAITYVGATPVFVDVDPETFNRRRGFGPGGVGGRGWSRIRSRRPDACVHAENDAVGKQHRTAVKQSAHRESRKIFIDAMPRQTAVERSPDAELIRSGDFLRVGRGYGDRCETWPDD